MTTAAGAQSTIQLATQDFLKQKPWPTRATEAWKYSSSQHFLDQEWQLVSAVSDATALLSSTNLAFARELSAWSHVILIAGFTHQTFGKLPAGVKILSEAISDQPPVVNDVSHIRLLNDELVQHVITIEIQATTNTRTPISILIPSIDGVASGTQVKVKVAANARAEIFEWVGSTSGVAAALMTSQFDYDLSAGAHLSVVRLENADRNAVVMTHSQAQIAEDAKLETWHVDVGHAWSRQEWAANLNGENAHAQLYGIMHAGFKRHVDHQTHIQHVVGNTTSKQIYKSILNEGSRAVFNGRIVIPQDSQKSNSQMLNKNLLLSRKCEIDAKPELLVSANDVKAAHGCTVGQLNDDELFYLATRCIDPDQARMMLAKGFALDTVLSIENSEIRSLAIRQLDQALAFKMTSTSAQVLS